MENGSDLMRLVEGLTDAQVIALLKKVNRHVFEAIPVDALDTHAKGESQESDFLLSIDADTRRTDLGSPEAVAAARSILRGFASEKNLARFVEQAWREVSVSRDLPLVEVIIPLGLMINLAILLATTEIKFKNGKFELRKGKASASLLKELLQPVVELVKGARGQN